MSAPDNHAIATALIAKGLKLVPMHPVDEAGWCTCAREDCNGKTDPHGAGKHPRWKARQFTADASWWRGIPRDPVGIDREASGIVTVEDDGGLAGWREAAGVELPPTLTWASPAGRLRFAYRLPDGFDAAGNHVRADGFEADILCKGRAPGPGVRSNGGQYAMVRDEPVADAHPALVAWLEQAHAARPPGRSDQAGSTEPAHVPETVRKLIGDGPAGGWPRAGTHGGADRSAMMHAIVMECFDTGMEPGEAAWLCEGITGLEDKYGERPGGVAGQAEEIWAKAEAKAGDEPGWLAGGEAPSPLAQFSAPKRWLALAARRGIVLAAPAAAGLNGQQGLATAAQAGVFVPTAVIVPRRVVSTPMSQITPRRVRWSWTGLLATGALSVLGGREGAGKSLLAYTIAAGITRGTLAGEFMGTPRTVCVISREDDPESVIVPRLIGAGADLDRVRRLAVATAEDPDTGLVLPADLAELARELADTGAALLILDPIMSHLDTALDTHKDAEVRRALEPLTRVARETGCTVLGLIHPNKSGSTDPLTSIMASKAFTTVPRTILFVMEDPGDETGKRRVMSLEKCNVGRRDARPRAFAIDDQTVAEDPDDGRPVTTAVLRWTGERPSGSVPAMLAAAQHGPERVTRTDRAADWLETWLDGRGPADSAEAKAAGAGAGYARRTVERAAAQIGVIVENTSAKPRRTTWELPHDPGRATRAGGYRQLAPLTGEETFHSSSGGKEQVGPVAPVAPVAPSPESPRARGATAGATKPTRVSYARPAATPTAPRVSYARPAATPVPVPEPEHDPEPPPPVKPHVPYTRPVPCPDCGLPPPGRSGMATCACGGWAKVNARGGLNPP